MNFSLTEEQLMIQRATREFAQNELKPGVIERDTHQTYPEKQVKMMAEMGLLGMTVDPKYGSSGMDTISYAIAVEEISKIDNSCSVIMSVNNSLVCWGISRYGTDEQKSRYLPILATGEKIGGFCLSEPEAGSDATQQHTKAEDHGEYYVLNGIKNWITNGKKAGVYIVMAQTYPEKKHRGVNAFIVEADWEGVSSGPKEDKMGIRSSDTSSVMFRDVKVPKENRIGEDGFGFSFAMKTLDVGRIGIAAQALGIASGAYELSLAYARERESFGKPIIKHQAIAFKLADMATQIEAARIMVYRAAWLKDQGMSFTRASAMAKLHASDVAMAITVEAVQVHGGYGFVKEYHVERLMRDAKITQIYEGTSEIQRLVISRSINRGAPYISLESGEMEG